MNIDILQDRIAHGSGIASRKLGVRCVVYRPSGSLPPIRSSTKMLELMAAFEPATRGMSGRHAGLFWRATLDSIYSREGDYLVAGMDTYYVASQRPALPITCVLTNTRWTFVRPSVAMQGSYSGLYGSGGTVLLETWPGCVLDSAGGDLNKSTTVTARRCTLMLPSMSVVPLCGDFATDESGTNYVVEFAELTAVGWRIGLSCTVP